MIGNSTKGTGFRGVLDYNMQEKKLEEIIHKELMDGENPRELSSEFADSYALNDQVNKPVFHVSLAVGEEDGKLPKEKWADIAQKYMKNMGFEANQWVAMRHNDAAHDHIHIVASRIRLDNGKVVNDWQDKTRSQQVIRDLEVQHGLAVQVSSQEVGQKAPTHGELELMKQTQQPSTKLRLQETINAARVGKPEFGVFLERLQLQGVGIQANIQSTGRVSGISFDLNGQAMKGSALGKKFSWKSIIKDVQYEENRDFSKLSEATELSKHRATGRGPGQAATAEVGLDRRVGRHDPALGEGHGNLDRRLGRDPKGSPGPDQEFGAERVRLPAQIGERSPSLIPRPEGSSKGNRFIDLLAKSENVANRNRNLGNSRDSVESILDLAGEQKVRRSTGPAQSGMGRKAEISNDGGRNEQPDSRALSKTDPGAKAEHRPDIRPDRTQIAVEKQINSMKCGLYDVGVRRKNGQMILRKDWEPEKIMDALNWLKRENVKGADIYIRPSEVVENIVLVDDLTRERIKEMAQDGIEPAAVIETSKNNFQAWVKFKDDLSKELRTEIANDLASKYGGDANSADWRHFGRLGGLTNQKPSRKIGDQSPFALVHEHSGKTAQNGPDLIDRAKTTVGTKKRENAISEAYVGARIYKTDDLKAAYTKRAKKHMEKTPLKPTGQPDWSRIDFRVGCDMFKLGYTKSQVSKALEIASPMLANRKAGHVGDYVARTVDAVMQNPGVKAALKALKIGAKITKPVIGPKMDR
jgi:hypothetical protein